MDSAAVRALARLETLPRPEAPKQPNEVAKHRQETKRRGPHATPYRTRSGYAYLAVVGVLSGGLAPSIKVGDGDDLLVGGNDESLSKQLVVAFWQGPGFTWVSETKAHQVAFLRWRILKLRAGMENGKVVDELNVAELLVQLDAILVGKFLYGFQSEMLSWSRKTTVLEERRPNELEDDSAVLVEEGRHPVWCSRLRAFC